jgi:hypothetical protein
MPEPESISTAYIRSLQTQIHLLRQICRAASAILSDDDSFETVRGRFHGELRDKYVGAKAEYFQFTGRSAP